MNILRVDNEFVEELACSLRPEDEEVPLGILSNLKELRFSGGGINADAFTPFIKERQGAGHPVSLEMANASEFPFIRSRE